MKGKKDLAKLTKKTITDKNGITRTVWVKLDKDTKVDKPKKSKNTQEKTKEKIDYQPIFDWMDKARVGDTLSFRSAIDKLNDMDKLHIDASEAYLKTKGITLPQNSSKLGIYQKLTGIAKEEAKSLFNKGAVGALIRGIENRKGGLKAFIEKYGEEVEALLFSDSPANNLVALQKIKEMTPTIQDFPKKVGTEYLASIIVSMKLPEISKNKTKQDKSSKNKKSSSDSKVYKSIPTEDLITLAKDNELFWKESSDPRINRMRVIMALKSENISPDTSVIKPKAKKSEDKKTKYSSVEDLARAIESKNDMEILIDEGYKEFYKWDTGEDPNEEGYDNYIPPREIQHEADMIMDSGIVEAINNSIEDLSLEGEDIDYDDPEHGEQVIEDLKSDNPDKVLEALKYVKSTISEYSMELPFGSALMVHVVHNTKLPE